MIYFLSWATDQTDGLSVEGERKGGIKDDSQNFSLGIDGLLKWRRMRGQVCGRN